MAKSANVKLDLTDREIRAIGLVAANWALLESGLEIVLSNLVPFPLPHGKDNPAKLPFKRRLHKLVELTKAKIPALDHAALDDLAKDIAKAHTKRNLYLHAVWSTGGDTGPALTISFRMDNAMRQRRLSIEFGDVDVADVEAAAQTIRDTGYAFHEFFDPLGLFQPP